MLAPIEAAIESHEHRSFTCFVIGPIGNRHAPVGSDERLTYEDALQVVEEVIQPACAAVGLEPVRADGLARAGEITDQVFRRLRDDDVVIADLTGANANVMYELGLRHTRDKLTLQIGEDGRLPFDVNVIRTVMFSRSAHGLIQARNELTELLRAGLAGQYDPVAATRTWNELSDATGAVEGPAPENPPTDDEPEPPGFLDLVAEGEEQQERLLACSEEIARLIAELGELAEASVTKTNQSDAQGRGMKGRLAIAIEFANGMSQIGETLEGEVDSYVEAMGAISDANLAIIERLEDDPSQLEEAIDWSLLTRRLAETARDSMGQLSGMVASMEENAKLSRVLREPTRRITAALERQKAATAVVDEWDRRLQALGVPVPPEDWEPQTEDGGQGAENLPLPNGVASRPDE